LLRWAAYKKELLLYRRFAVSENKAISAAAAKTIVKTDELCYNYRTKKRNLLFWAAFFL